MRNRILVTILLGSTLISCKPSKNLIILKEQGSFAVGGSVIKNEGVYDPIKRTPDGQSFHGDHAYVTYQIPDKAKKLPLVSYQFQRC